MRGDYSGVQDAGFRMAFDSLRVKFKPTAKDMQRAEESGTDLAQALLKQQKKQAKQASSQAKSGEPQHNNLLLLQAEAEVLPVCRNCLRPPVLLET